MGHGRLLQVKVQLRVAPHQPDTVEVWYHGAYYGLAVRADVAGEALAPPAAPPVSPTPTTRLSYLRILAEQQRAGRPIGLQYDHTTPKEDPP